MPRRLTLGLAVTCAASPFSSPAFGWDCHGHRTITTLAQEVFAERVRDAGDGAELPCWLTSDIARATAASNACEPDRYRAIRSPYMGHENNLEHYLDVEDLEPFGLTLRTVPPLRYEFLRAMAIAKHEHPDGLDADKPGGQGGFKPYNEKTDPTRTGEWPGFGLHACSEHYWKLVSSFRTERTLEKLNDPRRGYQLDAARAAALAEMGHLAHFVGDLAQPLHTTTHHHGWVGDNPEGYTTDRGIHSYIDGAILDIHNLDAAAVRASGALTPELRSRVADAQDPWNDLVAHVERSFAEVEPLYRMKKSGALEQEAGKAFIAGRLADGAATLAALYVAAWQASDPTEKDVADFVKYDNFDAKSDVPPPTPGADAPAPAAGP